MENRIFIIRSSTGEMVKSINYQTNKYTFSKDIFKVWKLKTDAERNLKDLIKMGVLTPDFEVCPLTMVVVDSYLYKDVDDSAIENNYRYVLYNPFSDCYFNHKSFSTKNLTAASSYASIQNLKEGVKNKFYPEKPMKVLVPDETGCFHLEDLVVPPNTFDNFKILKVKLT